MRERGHLFLPVVAILVVMYSGYSAPLAALAGVLACFPVAALRKSTRHYVTFENVIAACVDGARNALPVALACAAAGVVIAVVTLTGLGIVFTQYVVHLSQNFLLLALIFTMIAGIVLGMGMPTTPAYIIMTALLVPAIVKFGVPIPGRAHVRVLFRDPFGDHAAGCACSLCGRGSCQIRPMGNRLGGSADRGDQLHRAVHVRLRAGAADDRRLAEHHLGELHCQQSGSCSLRPACMAISSLTRRTGKAPFWWSPGCC